MSLLQRQFIGSFVKTALLPISFAIGVAHAGIVTIPANSLNNSPGVYTPGGYYTDSLGSVAVMTGGGNAANVGGATGRNDDGFSFLNLGFDVKFFGTTYNSLYVNNNGNVSFGAGISAYIPSGLTGANAPVISPFFGDVDTRPAQSGVVHVNTSTANQLVVTWDNVGRYNTRGDLLNSFQLVLRGEDYSVPFGEGAIGFFYGLMPWSQTDTSTVAAVGFGDGQGNATVIAGSTDPNVNTVLNNKYIWFDANLNVVPPDNTVPEPGVLALLAIAGVGAMSVARRRKA